MRELARIDALVAGLAPVHDENLRGAAGSPAAAALLAAIVAVPPRPRARRLGPFALAGAVLAAAALSLPALGIGREVASFFAGWKDPGAPVPHAPDVVIAADEAGRWKLVATTSDRGLCLGTLENVPLHGWIGSAACEPTGVRGDPWAADPRHWIGPYGVPGDVTAAPVVIAFGPVAERVASVELQLSDGTSVAAQVVERPVDAPLDLYWAAWPCEPCESELPEPVVALAVARDESGRVLERRRPSWNGNPTGDPRGPLPPSLDDGR